MPCFIDAVYFFAIVATMNIVYWLFGMQFRWMHGRWLKIFTAFNLTLIIASLIQSNSSIWPTTWWEQLMVTFAVSHFLFLVVSIPFHLVYPIVSLLFVFVTFSTIRDSLIRTVQSFTFQSFNVSITYAMAIAILLILFFSLLLFVFLLHQKRVNKIIEIGVIALIGAFKVTVSFHILYITYQNIDLPRFCCDDIAIEANPEDQGICPMHLNMYLLILLGVMYALIARIMWVADGKWGKLPVASAKNIETVEEQIPLTKA
jgi:hypothetical protein